MSTKPFGHHDRKMLCFYFVLFLKVADIRVNCSGWKKEEQKLLLLKRTLMYARDI